MGARRTSIPRRAGCTAATFAAADAKGAAEAQLTLAGADLRPPCEGGTGASSVDQPVARSDTAVRDPSLVLKDLDSQPDAAATWWGCIRSMSSFSACVPNWLKRLGGGAPPRLAKALLVKLPAEGATIKPGSLHPGHCAFAQALEAAGRRFAGQEDAVRRKKLAAAVTAFQTEKGLKANGQLNRRTRTALNREGESKEARITAGGRKRIVINMERWRWNATISAPLTSSTNVPEYITRTFKDGKVIFKEKIVVGPARMADAVVSAEMKTIVFNPSWGVPDGIKRRI